MTYQNFMIRLGWTILAVFLILALANMGISLYENNQSIKPTENEKIPKISPTHIWIAGKSDYKPDYKPEWLIDKIETSSIDDLTSQINQSIKKSQCMIGAPAYTSISGQKDLEEFINIRKDEELWTYCSPNQSWRNMGGVMGLVLIEHHELRAQISLIIN